MSPKEKELLSMETVKVTSQRLSVGARTFQISQINNVQVGSRRSHVGGVLLILLGMFMACIGSSIENGDAALILIFLLMTVGVIGLGVYSLVKAKPTYVIIVGTPSGPAKIYASKDKARVDAITDALHRALFDQDS